MWYYLYQINNRYPICYIFIFHIQVTQNKNNNYDMTYIPNFKNLYSFKFHTADIMAESSSVYFLKLHICPSSISNRCTSDHLKLKVHTCHSNLWNDNYYTTIHHGRAVHSYPRMRHYHDSLWKTSFDYGNSTCHLTIERQHYQLNEIMFDCIGVGFKLWTYEQTVHWCISLYNTAHMRSTVHCVIQYI